MLTLITYLRECLSGFSTPGSLPPAFTPQDLKEPDPAGEEHWQCQPGTMETRARSPQQVSFKEDWRDGGMGPPAEEKAVHIHPLSPCCFEGLLIHATRCETNHSLCLRSWVMRFGRGISTPPLWIRKPRLTRKMTDPLQL